MTGKGKMNLSFKYTGKRQEERRRHSYTDSRDYTCDFPRGNGGGDATLSGFQADALALGWLGQTIPFLGYDASGVLGKIPSVAEENQMSGLYTWRSPKNTSKGAVLARKLRGLRGSPEPVSSLESCLRAQMLDAAVSSRVSFVSRPLDFSTSVAEEFEEEDDDGDDEATLMGNSTASPSTVGYAVEDSTSKSRMIALPKLPNLPKFLKENAAKLLMKRKAEIVTKGDSSSRRVRSDDSAPSFSNAGNGPISPPFETLLFSFGLALGVLFASSQEKTEAKRLSQLLEETQAELEILKLELARRETHAHTNRFDSAIQDSEPQEDQMAELEAELEAELDQLTGGDSVAMESQYSALDEMDVDASVVYGDLAPAGLPAEVEDDTDEELSPSGRPVCSNNYAVSPRELTRLLRKLQTARQEVLINELEEDLEAALSKLQSREKELEVWKDRVMRLTEGSLVPAWGDEFLSQCTLTDGVTRAGTLSSIRDEASEASAASRDAADHIGGQEPSQPPALGNDLPAVGTVSKEEPARLGSNLTLEPAAQAEPKSSLDIKSRKEDSKEVGRMHFDGTALSGHGDPSTSLLQSMIRLDEDGSSHGDASSRDCRPILDNAQIITQLIDSVHGIELYVDRAESVEMGSATPSLGLFSSSVSISDTWDHPLESAVTPEGFRYGDNRGTSLSRAKPVVPHPNRRTSWNSDLGSRMLNRKLENDMSSSSDANQSPDVVRCSEVMESSKSVSVMSEAEPADYRTTKTPSSAKYLDSTKKPGSEGAVGFGRAGVTTPVEKAKELFSRTPHTAPVKWSGDLSPTVLEKIARWEGLMEGETPGPATGSDWECQSRASESEQHYALESEYDNVNVFSEENLVLEAEEMLGRMLIKRIVEKSRLGSDSLVKKAQSALATLERDNKVEADMYDVADTYMNDRTDSEADFSDDNREKQESSLVDAAVREEYEFFRRLEIISKDRKAMKGVTEKGAKEAADPGGVKFDFIPELNLGSNDQLSPGSRLYRTTQVLSQDAERQPKMEQVINEAAEPNTNGGDNWLSGGVGLQDSSRGRDYRIDEVRSRRRL